MKRVCFLVGLVTSLCAVSAVAQVLPPERLDGPFGGAGTMGVLDYRPDFGSFDVQNNLTLVMRIVRDIQSGALQAIKTEAQIPLADVTDPDTNINGGPVVTGEPNPYPSDEPGVDDNEIISVAHARVRVPEAGTYTVQVRSDDGFALRFRGAQWTGRSGGGAIDTRDRETLVFRTGTGDSNTRGFIDLQAKDYDVEFVSWENEGGAFWEITSAQGQHANAGGAQWLALGDGREIPATTLRPPAKLTGPLVVHNLDGILDLDLEFARDEILDAVASGDTVFSEDIDTLHIDDDRTGLGCPFNEFPAFHDPNTTAQWPNTAGNVDFFSSLILGKLVVDDGDNVPGETLKMSFHVDSDDRASFRIKGADFQEITSDEIREIDGDDSMFLNRDACNTNVTATIELAEGVEYEFEAVHVENGGDAGIQVLAAIGDFVNDPIDATKFFVLTANPGLLELPRNIGFSFVSESGPIGQPGDFDGNGVLDLADINGLLGAIAAAGPVTFDLTGDNQVNQADLDKWVNDLKKTWFGDADLNGEFNTGDLVQIFQAGKFEQNVQAGWHEGDWTGNLRFDTGDLVAAFQAGGFEKGPKAATAAVPEPSSLALGFFAFVGLVALARRSR